MLAGRSKSSAGRSTWRTDSPRAAAASPSATPSCPDCPAIRIVDAMSDSVPLGTRGQPGQCKIPQRRPVHGNGQRAGEFTLKLPDLPAAPRQTAKACFRQARFAQQTPFSSAFYAQLANSRRYESSRARRPAGRSPRSRQVSGQLCLL